MSLAAAPYQETGPDSIAVGLIGFGYWGPNLARVIAGMHTDGVKLAAIAERNAVRRGYASELYPAVPVTENLEQMLDDVPIDAVVVATPVGSHFELARLAITRGKHVLVEKPLAASVVEAETLAAEAEQAEVILMAGHVFEYTAAVDYLKHMIDAGELGEILYVRSLRVNLGIYQTDINVLWDLAPHDISIINYVLGTEALSVSAIGNAHITEGVPDIVNLNLDYGNDTLATVVVSWLDPRKIREMTIIGSKKMLVYDDVSATEKIRIHDKGVDGPGQYQSFGEFHYSYRYGDIISPMLEHHEPLSDECRHFIECVRFGKQPRSDATSGLKVVRTLSAAQASLERGGARIELADPIVETANGHVSRSPSLEEEDL